MVTNTEHLRGPNEASDQDKSKGVRNDFGGLGRSITGGGENDRPAAPVVLVVDLDRGVVLAPDDVAEDGAVAVDRSAL